MFFLFCHTFYYICHMDYLNFKLNTSSDIEAVIKNLFISDKEYFCSNKDIYDFLKTKNVCYKSKQQIFKILSSFCKPAMVRTLDGTKRGFFCKTI